MDTDQMLSLLVENRLVSMATPRRVSDFIGDFNYLGYALLPRRLYPTCTFIAVRRQMERCTNSYVGFFLDQILYYCPGKTTTDDT